MSDGYIMLTLLLAMALMVIFAAVIVPSITFEIKRDREEEMIHRGVQYSRAIRAYYKKFGRYPTKIEDLENTNNLRFLRKRYKDPLNCKNSQCADFKLLHFGEVQMSLSGMGGGTIPGANPIGNGGLNGGPGGFRNLRRNSGLANSNSPFGQNQQTTGKRRQDRIPRRRERRLLRAGLGMEPGTGREQIRQERQEPRTELPEAISSVPGKSSAGRSSASPARVRSRTRRSASSITRRNIKIGFSFTIPRKIRDV